MSIQASWFIFCVRITSASSSKRDRVYPSFKLETCDLWRGFRGTTGSQQRPRPRRCRDCRKICHTEAVGTLQSLCSEQGSIKLLDGRLKVSSARLGDGVVDDRPPVLRIKLVALRLDPALVGVHLGQLQRFLKDFPWNPGLKPLTPCLSTERRPSPPLWRCNPGSTPFSTNRRPSPTTCAFAWARSIGAISAALGLRFGPCC